MISRFFISVLSICIGSFFIWNDLTRPNFDSVDDMLVIDGTVSKYTFEHNWGYRHLLTNYYLNINESKSTFQISADFEPFFKRDLFENNIEIGDTVELVIPKELKPELDLTNKRIVLFGITADKIEYLNVDETMEKHNNNLGLYFGLTFFLFSIGYFLFKK